MPLGSNLVAFYDRADPNTAGHSGFLTMDEARQMAVDFANLPELLERTSARSAVAKASLRAPFLCVAPSLHWAV
jgi:hypothetical protein